MVKPIALTMFKLNPVEYDEFIQEVESRMLEETDYTLELQRSMDLSEKTKRIKNIVFPTYYPEYSTPKILTMDWLEGSTLSEVLKHTLAQNERDKLGQAMWDFYHFQMHTLKAVHADPHPGNFIITPESKLGIIDFGCVKEISNSFYKIYFQLLDPEILGNSKKREKLFQELNFVYSADNPSEREFFSSVFTTLVELLGRPFRSAVFDFADNAYFDELYSFGQKISMMKEFRESKKARGVRDALYINRTYFGLYTILHDLKASIKTAY
jgi:predicted unusual protein kinase regulating ubiquinone biosynthesis (AarF/ABC1/UbiB family)